MIRYTQGNLLDADVEAVVNTVNTVGVMGKGIALQFREAFPDNYVAYQAACKRHEVVVGRVFVTETHALSNPRLVLNFPTKQHWRQPSRLEFITAGLKDLARVLTERKVRSVALPPLGCGNGGLDWAVVQPLIQKALGDLPGMEIVVFEPTAAYQTQVKATGQEKLTAARALLVDLVRRYGVVGFECTNLEVQKLAYFLQRFVEGMTLENPLKLRFEPQRYGPYADNLRHVLDSLDGSYLRCAKRLADAGPTEPVGVDYGRLPAVRTYLATPEMASYRRPLEATYQLIDGFETPFLMELLATVDWVRCSAGGAQLDNASLHRGIAAWPAPDPSAAERKVRLFDTEVIDLARRRLEEFEVSLFHPKDHRSTPTRE